MSKYDLEFDPNNLPLGLYEIFWMESEGGGSSLAAVGWNREGKRWHACTNHIYDRNGPSFDWSHVSSVQRIDSSIYPTENITLTRTRENGEWVSYSMSPNAAYNRQIINAALERIQEQANEPATAQKAVES